MSGRIVVFAASVCALWSLLVAGEARAFTRTGNRTAIRNSTQEGRANPLMTERPAATWPPRPMSRPRVLGRRGNGARGGHFGDAFMVDTGVTPMPAYGTQYSYGATSNGDGWRILWSDQNDYSVRTTGIKPDGSLLDASGRLVGYEDYSNSPLTRAIVGTGSGFVAVWPLGDYGIWAATLDSTGTLIDSFLVFESDSGQVEPAVAFDGDSTCLVVWTENPYGMSGGDIYATRVTTGGRVLDPRPVPVAQAPAQSEMSPTVAFGQDVYLVAWTAYDSTYMPVVKARRVSTGGVLLDTAIFLRHDPAAVQVYPAVAFGDTCFLAAWSEGMEQADVYAARVSASGNLIDTSGVQLSSGPGIDVYSSVGFDGTRYLVMWCELDPFLYFSSLRGRRVTVDGVPLDSGLIRPDLPGYASMYPSVAADQASFLVALTAYDTLAYDENVCCMRISPEGMVLDTGIFFPMGADAQYRPSGASDGTDFLAVWCETQAPGVAVSGARISAGGTVLDPVGFPVSTTPTNKTGLATGFGDSLYLVAWAEAGGGDGTDIYCARVGRDGQVLDPDGIVVCDEPFYQELPDVSFDGQNFLVVWQDYRSLMNSSIYAARVSPAGVVLDPDGFAVAADTFDDQAPAVCYTGAEHMVVWSGMDLNTRESNIYGARVTTAGTVPGPRFLVNGHAGDQLMPAIASGPTSALVAWQDARLSSYDIYAARVRADGIVLDPNGLPVAATYYDEQMPHVVSDEAGFRVLWSRWEYSDSTIYAAARVDTSGNVLHVGDWFGVPGFDQGFDAVSGSGPELLLLFSCWTDTAHGRSYKANRLWGRLGAVPGIEQAGNGQAIRAGSGGSVVRGLLMIEDRGRTTGDRDALLDISGRKVMSLQPGANDVSGLAPGVYFVRAAERASIVRKVIIAR